MKKYLTAALFLVSSYTHAFESQAGCDRILFNGVTVTDGTSIVLCVLEDGNFHYSQQKKEDSQPSIYFDIERKDVKFSSRGYIDYFTEIFSFVENDLKYELYYRMTKDGEPSGIVIITEPEGSFVLDDDLNPFLLKYDVTIDDVRGITQ